ncbi:uncharacterized protein LOC113465804 [Diaphorina citri]|uniref:Uncharacterized protein LOC113465804 n=1 Tax=Diaphorina citri TaxID=121845 RepID=A0A3Q0IJT6_DIACI|nr:uncharacterized protein LOC113465804 [Diaphorina citri]
MRNKAKKPGLLKEMYELSKEEHSSNIGQHMSQIYLKCFSKVDHTPYSQNDFVNIRKVVDFFLKYLVFEYKYLHLYKNVAMKNIIYSVYAKISQHHFRLKHHLSTSSELDPQNNPWPVKVYDQLTKFNILVNSNSSNTNYKESNTKLRPSFSTHSEHSIKYFAIDYFLKLLKIIVIEGQEGNDIHGESQKAAVSERATASSFNSHHYCHLESSTKTSSHCSKHSLHHEVTPRDIASYGTVGDVLTNSVETDNESAVNTTRFQSVKGKLKRFKKRKTRRSFIEKQLNRSANTKQAHVKQEPNLSRFELNRYVFNKTVKGKQLKSFQSLKTKSKIEVSHNIKLLRRHFIWYNKHIWNH